MIDHTTIKLFHEFFFHDDRERVIYGCGKNGVILVNWLKKYAQTSEQEQIKITKCVDGNKSLQSTIFADTYLIEDPTILMGKRDQYKVIVTPENPGKLCSILDSYGYQENIDYITMEIIEMISYEIIFEYLKKNRYHFQVVLAPDLFSKPHLTEIEQGLKGMDAVFDDKHRMEWLRTGPPHIQYCHKDIDYFSDEYVKNIFFPLEYYERDGVLYPKEYQSKYVNCTGGIRFTTDQPKNYKHRIYMYGSSFMYGFGVEDKYTIPSCLQRLLNQDQKEMLVVNYGIRGMRPEHLLAKIQNTPYEDGDLLFIYFASRTKAREFLMLNKIPFIDTNYFLRKRLPFEVFFDKASHLTFQGNLYITQCFYNMMYGGAPASLEQILHKNLFSQDDTKLPHTLSKEDNDAEHADRMDESLLQAIETLRMHKEQLPEHAVVGSIVVNCNPFTLGHYHLVHMASQMVDFLYIFVVEEDKSEFSFQDRFDLVKKGTSKIKNIKVIPSGNYIISSVTFPEYFDKEENQTLNLNLSEDVDIFGKYIAPVFDISIRFVGEEITDAVTRQYNETMKMLLPAHGIKLLEIPRAKHNGKYISATTVRQLYHQGKLDELRGYVPDTTFDYLKARSQSNTEI